MGKLALVLGSVYGLLAVAIGAFGAHGLKKIIPAQKSDLLTSFETGVRYQMYHAIVLLALGMYMRAIRREPTALMQATNFFSIGTLLFSGSIYLLVALQISNSVGLGKWGLITPIGGVLLLIAWTLLLVHFIRS